MPGELWCHERECEYGSRAHTARECERGWVRWTRVADAFATMLKQTNASLIRRARGEMGCTGVLAAGWRLRLRERAW